MQIVTVSVGYFIGNMGVFLFQEFFILLLGTILVSSSAGVLNQLIELDLDSKMTRTMTRPLVLKTIPTWHAILMAIAFFSTGVWLLFSYINPLTATIAMLTCFLYVVVYTPLKTKTWLNTFFGSFPGALPILGGWAAATGTLHFEVWPLFLVLFTWQHPHFYALAIMYKEDYSKAGFKMLPVVAPNLESTVRQSLIYTVLMILSSAIPFFLAISGFVYLVGVLMIGFMMFFYAFRLWRSKTLSSARKLFFSSIIYLPLWFLVIIIDFYLRL